MNGCEFREVKFVCVCFVNIIRMHLIIYFALISLNVFIIKSKEMHYFSTLFGKELYKYMFRTDLLSIIRSLDTVFTAIVICSILTSLADSQHN
jgi:hypothetical protein